MSHDTSGGWNLDELDHHWRVRVQHTQAHYKRAVEQHQHMVDELDQALIEPADGALAVASARRAMALALNEVMRCQQVLLKLVLRQEMPPTEDDEKLLV
jgi:hypothetical protein